MNVVSPAVTVAVHTDALIGESPVWSARLGQLMWIDILGRHLHRYDPASGRSDSIATPAPIGLLAESPSGQITLSRGVSWLAVAPTARSRPSPASRTRARPFVSTTGGTTARGGSGPA
ncbi:SMP-30/gluconolactonase/LRE family protein [Salinicola halophilus]|uniref:SMP-30/gluconolactonase/LRE family protein n=1 Tax=Salinicola halophilus TaxID=184065 RepID=UPI0019551305